MAKEETPVRHHNVLVFGLERVGLPVPTDPIRTENFSFFFEPYGTARRFNEFDGAVIFQGLFETFKARRAWDDSRYYDHTCDFDELDKRKKEAALLTEKGGFLCFLLTEPFLDEHRGVDYRLTDLAKFHLSYQSLYRKNYPNRVAHVTPVVSEFKRFLDLFGGASSYLENHSSTLSFRPLAKVGSKIVGALIGRAEYFVPSLIPDGRTEVVAEFFTVLVDAVTAVHNKLHEDIPDWISAYRFDEEQGLLEERAELVSKISTIDARRKQLDKYKAALFHSGPELTADVAAILEIALGLKVDQVDEFREDLKLLGADGKPICICEVKGINRGIKRENINQTDSHRERSGFNNQFPALLIANTNIKSASSIAEKDQEVASEQVAHAVRMHILLLRTIDLIGLLRLVLAGKMSPEGARKVILSSTGWVRVVADEVKLLSGD